MSEGEVLLVSKPVVPPWHDSSKNLVRDLATHMGRHTPIVLSRAGAHVELGRARIEPLYSADAGGFSPALADNLRVLRRLVLGPRPSLWHFFFAPNPRTSTVAKLAATARGMRTVQTVCSAPADHVDPRAVLFAERIVVLSRHTERRFLDAGIDAARLRLIRPSIPALEPRSESERASVRTRLSLPESAPIVLYAGDLEFGKGAELALRAHRALPASLGAWLVMACRTKTAAAKDKERTLREQAESMGTASRISWLGETRFIHDLLAAADVVTLPTDTLYAKMDMPLVLVEAMALERAVVVGRGTPAEELAEGGAARAVETEVDAVAEVTRSLLEDAHARVELGRRGRAHVQRRYAPERMAHEYEAVYDELLAP